MWEFRLQFLSSNCLTRQPEKGFVWIPPEWSRLALIQPVGIRKMASEKSLSLGLAAVTKWPVMGHIAVSHVARLLLGKEENS